MKFIGWNHLIWWCGFQLARTLPPYVYLACIDTWICTCAFARPPNLDTVDHKCHKIFACYRLYADNWPHTRQLHTNVPFYWVFTWVKTDRKSTIYTCFKINEITAFVFLCKIFISIHLRFSTSIVYFYTYFCLIELKWKERQWKSLSERATYNRKKKKMVKNAYTKSISSSSNSDGRNHRRFGIYDIGCINSQKWITNRW